MKNFHIFVNIVALNLRGRIISKKHYGICKNKFDEPVLEEVDNSVHENIEEETATEEQKVQIYVNNLERHFQ